MLQPYFSNKHLINPSINNKFLQSQRANQDDMVLRQSAMCLESVYDRFKFMVLFPCWPKRVACDSRCLHCSLQALTEINRIAAAAFGLPKIYGEIKHDNPKLFPSCRQDKLQAGLTIIYSTDPAFHISYSVISYSVIQLSVVNHRHHTSYLSPHTSDLSPQIQPRINSSPNPLKIKINFLLLQSLNESCKKRYAGIKKI